MEKLKGNSVIVRNKDIDALLQQSPVQGKRVLEPLKTFSKESGIPLNVLEDTSVSNVPEVHRHEADLWYCLEGEVDFVCGGELVEPKAKVNKDGSIDEREWSGTGIQNGTKITLKSGDWLWIPPGEAHQHAATATARLVIIKIPQRP